MKWLVLSLLAVTTSLKTHQTRHEIHGRSPVSQIVEMLKGMAQESEADGKAEAETFDKFQKTISEKGQAISELKELMASTENRMEKLTALSSELSSKKSQLTEDLEEKKGIEAESIAARENEEKTFKQQEAEMAANLASLQKALSELNEVSANPQAVSLLSTDPQVLEVTKQLESVAEEARGFLTPTAAGAVAMLRQPYEQQSGGVLGTLQSVKDTYEKDLKELRGAEESQKQSHGILLQQLQSEQAELSKMLEMTKAELASTEEELLTRKSQLTKAKADLGSENALKAEAEKILVQKTSAFEERKELRSQEATAIAKAIAVLNSDAAFATFCQVTGASFVQMGAAPKQAAAVALLRRAAQDAHSARLGHAATVAATAPFAKVIEEIETMQKVIQAEGKADEKKSAWCAAELSKNAAGQKAKTGQMDTLKTAITELDATIAGPVDGLELTLNQAREDLKRNEKDQEDITASRKSENKNYQKKVQDLQDAKKLVKTAMTVLRQYYTKLALLQGESKLQGGQEVLKMLQDVLDDTKSEEDAAHKTEGEAQASFEDNLALLTQSEADLKKSITDTTKEIADTKKELTEKHEMLEKTKQEKMSLAEYLADVQPDCAWLKAALGQREANRQAESTSLTEAIQLIKGTPAYQKAM
eukprot:s32_g13.t4